MILQYFKRRQRQDVYLECVLSVLCRDYSSIFIQVKIDDGIQSLHSLGLTSKLTAPLVHMYSREKTARYLVHQGIR